ncbi:MAG: hypothetical protein FWE17_00510 [Alphaproteobacteria bacterium]|nr:hypothetical protein [Alphaproteobacteria bacterium]MCL2757707.1 hypothetical protein [Alphaproteobacteria bacterium]
MNKDKKYTGAMILGMHDALVEFIGMIVGLTFALADSRLVLVTVIIAGITASMSMGASNYLAQKADGNPDAVKAGIYTGMAYVITVALLVAPFVMFSGTNMVRALALMFAIAVLIIATFSGYVSVVQNRPFAKSFLEMIAVCAGVSVIAFGIGQLVSMTL